METREIISQFTELSYVDQKKLIKSLQTKLYESKPILVHRNEVESCPHCGHHKFHRHGKYMDGRTRFKCTGCNRTFNELTGTCIHGIKKKALLAQYVQLMFESRSLRSISEELNIAEMTAFNWRHKILNAFDELFTKEFKGIVETDDVYFRFNQKGRSSSNMFFKKKRKERGLSNDQVSVMVTMDRYKTYDFKIAKFGKINFKVIDAVMDKSRFNQNNIICSDSNKSIINFFKQMGLTHKTFNVKKGQYTTEGIYHVNHLNNAVMRLKEWIKHHFSSVSTKYLSHYLNWFMMNEIMKGSDDSESSWWSYMLRDSKSFDRNLGVEHRYLVMLAASL